MNTIRSPTNYSPNGISPHQILGESFPGSLSKIPPRRETHGICGINTKHVLIQPITKEWTWGLSHWWERMSVVKRVPVIFFSSKVNYGPSAFFAFWSSLLPKQFVQKSLDGPEHVGVWVWGGWGVVSQGGWTGAEAWVGGGRYAHQG